MANDPFLAVAGQADSNAPGDRENQVEDAAANTDLIRIMIVEDEEAHFHLMKRAIGKELPGASILHISNAAACLEQLDSTNPDMILIDYLLPGMTGIEFLEAIKRKGCDIPVVMITGQGNESIAVQAMKLGAQDYLVKGADFFLLLPAVVGQVARERRLKLNLQRVARLNALLLESLPYPAMMISRDRIVLAANRICLEMGVRLGNCCWQDFSPGPDSGHRPGGRRQCPFCRLDDAFRLFKAINSPELDINGRVWDIWWIPIDDEVCLNYAIDVTERKQAEQALRTNSRFLEIANRHADMSSLLAAFVKELKDATGCGATAIRVLNSGEGAPFVYNEGCELPLPPPEAEERVDMQDSFLPGGYLSTASVPIRLEGRILGSLYLADTRKGMLPPEKIAMVATAAMKLAAAIERISSREQLRKSERDLRFLSSRLMTAQEDERKRISRELHDSVGSSLCSIRLSLENCIYSGKSDIESLRSLVSLTQGSIDEVRRIITDLRPSILDEMGIVAALRSFCVQFKKIHPHIGVKRLIWIVEQDVPEALKIVMFRIVQESFNNIAKYSRAGSVTLALGKKDGVLQLSVIDDGVGFDPEISARREVFNGGIGLTSMKERVELSGGSFRLDSRQGEGTTISACWKL